MGEDAEHEAELYEDYVAQQEFETKQARKAKAAVILNLLVVEKRFELELSKLVLRMVEHKEHDAEAWFDTLFEAEAKRDREFAKAKEHFHNLLFHLTGGSTEHARSQFEMRQHSRRRRQGKQRKSEI